MKKRSLTVSLFVLLLLCLLSVVSFAATSSPEIEARLKEISTTGRFRVGQSYGTDGCWRFAKAVEQEMFGVNIPSGTGGQYRLTVVPNTWTTIATIKGGNGANAKIRDLLKQSAKPGDLIQFRSSATSQHTAVIYSVSSTELQIFEHTNSTGVTITTIKWSNFGSKYNNIGSFETGLYNAGLSLYRCNLPIKASIKLNKTSITAINNQRKYQLRATTEPASGLTVQWQSSNTNLATVDKNGLVTITGKGTGKVTITASIVTTGYKSSNTYKATCTIQIPSTFTLKGYAKLNAPMMKSASAYSKLIGTARGGTSTVYVGRSTASYYYIKSAGISGYVLKKYVTLL